MPFKFSDKDIQHFRYLSNEEIHILNKRMEPQRKELQMYIAVAEYFHSTPAVVTRDDFPSICDWAMDESETGIKQVTIYRHIPLSNGSSGVMKELRTYKDGMLFNIRADHME